MCVCVSVRAFVIYLMCARFMYLISETDCILACYLCKAVTKKPHSFCTLHTLRQPQAHTSTSNSRSKQRGWDKCVLSGLYVCTCLCECDDIITTAEHSIVDWWRKGCYGRLLRAQCPPARQLDLTTLCVCACVRACVCVSCSSCKMINRKDTLAICWKGKFVT